MNPLYETLVRGKYLTPVPFVKPLRRSLQTCDIPPCGTFVKIW